MKALTLWQPWASLMAIGAKRGQIILQFLREGLQPSVLGCFVGLAIAVIFTRVLNGMLYGVTSTDSLTFAGVAALVLLTAPPPACPR